MALMKLVLQPWGVEIHTRKDEKDTFKQTGAAVESGGTPSAPGLPALEHYLGRKVTIGERSTLKSKGSIEI